MCKRTLRPPGRWSSVRLLAVSVKYLVLHKLGKNSSLAVRFRAVRFRAVRFGAVTFRAFRFRAIHVSAQGGGGSVALVALIMGRAQRQLLGPLLAQTDKRAITTSIGTLKKVSAALPSSATPITAFKAIHISAQGGGGSVALVALILGRAQRQLLVGPLLA